MINPIELNNDEKYFADTEHMSASLFKKMAKCEVDGLIPFGEMTSSMMVGSYVDAYVSGTLDEFKQAHPEIISSQGKTKGELKAEFKKADEICKFIDTNERLQQFLSGDKQTVMTGVIAGVPYKIKIDSYSKGIAINDLKVMYTVTNNKGEFIDFISQYGYDIQLAIYQEIVYQNTGDKLPCFICAVTKETPINSVIINIPQHVLDKKLGEVMVMSPRYYRVIKGEETPIGCGKCSSCISSRKETPILSLEDCVGFM